MRLILLCVLLSLPVAAPAFGVGCPAPRGMTFHVERQVPRDTVGFTEGLEVYDGNLYESTGDYFGDSRINRIDLKTGKVTALLNAGKDYFGEGLTFFGGRVYQMTWREHQVFVFDRDMHRLATLANPREGWGLTHDATRLIASDGSDRLFFIEPADFHTLGSVPVRRQTDPVSNLNELEYAEGAVYANVYETWQIVRISPRTGCVEAQANLENLRDQMSPADQRRIDFDENFVLNGIAYDPVGGHFILTGKYWPMLFVGRFEED
ncbi:MAG TPA: glutaminyl-peptide cyclotransferase [Rhizomicrobium sp.]|jgi:glutamine cyclotransferase|nr:glutaminyl-peptide cyclotransferase [Rhizomicrobium sp.]